MTALKDDELDALCVHIKDMGDVHRQHVRCGLTHAEVMSAYIHPEDHAVLLRYRDLFPSHGHRMSREITGPGETLYWLHMTAAADGTRPFPLPEYVSQPLPGTPKKLKRRIEDLQREIMDISLRYGHLKLVLHALDQLCKNPAQIRFFFPPFETLVNGLGAFKLKSDLLKRINTRSRDALPAIPPELRAEIDIAAATVTMFGMLPEPTANSEEVVIAAYTTSGFESTCSIGAYTGL